eukprot:jgi/Mesen1/2709/ME000168S01775
MEDEFPHEHPASGLKGLRPLRRLERKRLALGDEQLPQPSEKDILDSLLEEYNFRAAYRLHFCTLLSFVAFIVVYLSMLYLQLANSDAFKMHEAMESLVPPFNQFGKKSLTSFDSVYNWLNQSVVQNIWSEPPCGNGVCNAPVELPAGIYDGRGCALDCGDVRNVTFVATLFGETARAYVRDPTSWDLKLCYGASSTSLASFTTCINGTIVAYAAQIQQDQQTVRLDLQFYLNKGKAVEWVFDAPRGADYELNMTISSTILSIFGGPKGFSFGSNSLNTWWVSSSTDSRAQVLNAELLAGDAAIRQLCKGGISYSQCVWPYAYGDQPQKTAGCCLLPAATRVRYKIPNPTHMYYQLLISTPRTIGGADKQSNRLVMGVLLHLTRRMYSHKQCGDYSHEYNRTSDEFYHEYPHRFGRLAPWCEHHIVTPTTPFGHDPTFMPTSSLFRPGLNPADFYPPSEIVNGVPQAFYNVTNNFYTKDVNENAFYVLLDVNMNTSLVQEWLTYLRDGQFLDSNSHHLVVRVLSFNGIYHLFTLFKAELLFEDSGDIAFVTRTDALRIQQSTGSWVLLVLFVAGVALLLGQGSMAVMRRWKLYNHSVHRVIRGSLLEGISNTLFLVQIIMWWVIHERLRSFKPQPSYNVYSNLITGLPPRLQLNHPAGKRLPADDMNHQFEDFEDIMLLKKVYVFVAAINTLLLLARVLKLSHFHPRLGLLTRTLQNIIPDLAAYLFVWALITVGFAVMGMISFGDQLKQFHSLSQAINTMFSLYLGTIDVNNDLLAIGVTFWDQGPARLFFWSYMIIANLVLLNFLIAIVIDMFSEVKDKNNKRSKLVNRMASELSFSFGSWRYMRAAYYFRKIMLAHKASEGPPEDGKIRRTITKAMDAPIQATVGRLRLHQRGSSGGEGSRAGDVEAASKEGSQTLMPAFEECGKAWTPSDSPISGKGPCEQTVLDSAGHRITTSHSLRTRAYAHKALIVDGVEVKNEVLLHLIHAHLKKAKGGKAPRKEEVRYLFNYIVACYGGASTQDLLYDGDLEQQLQEGRKRLENMQDLADDLRGELHKVMDKEGDIVASRLLRMEANMESTLKVGLESLQAQIRALASEVQGANKRETADA